MFWAGPGVLLGVCLCTSQQGKIKLCHSHLQSSVFLIKSPSWLNLLNPHERMSWVRHVEWSLRQYRPHPQKSDFFGIVKGQERSIPMLAIRRGRSVKRMFWATSCKRAGKTVSTLRLTFTTYQLSYWQASVRLKRTYLPHPHAFIGKILLTVWAAPCVGQP